MGDLILESILLFNTMLQNLNVILFLIFMAKYILSLVICVSLFYCFFLLQPLKENRFVIPKSRYDSVSTYLSPEGDTYNDIDLVYDKKIGQQLIAAG